MQNYFPLHHRVRKSSLRPLLTDFIEVNRIILLIGKEVVDNLSHSSRSIVYGFFYCCDEFEEQYGIL
jgi:hypothetical protein